MGDLRKKILRGWRGSPLRIGHVGLRRLFERTLPRQQSLQVAPGIMMPLDIRKHNQSTLYWYGDHEEPALQWAIRTLLPVGGTFVDCGANNGFMSLIAAGWRSARVLALEPHPRLAEKIRETVAANGIGDQIEVLEVAADCTAGDAPFFESPDNDGAHSLEAEWPEATRQMGTVPTQPLADILSQRSLCPVHFLKIDTEGHDLNVLQSLGDDLRPQSVHCIFTEATWNSAAIIDLLSTRGYSGYVALNRKFHTVQKLRRRETEGVATPWFRPLRKGENEVDNLLWCPADSSVAQLLNRLD